MTLNSAGSITQSQPIVGNLLTTSSAGGTTLTNASNAVTGFTATNTTSGNIALTNTAAPLTLNGSNVSQSGGGNVIIANTGAINTVGWVQTTGNGNISLTATNGTATIGNSLITGNDNTSTGTVSVNATGASSDVVLNNINVYSGSTGGGAGNISLTAGRDIKLNPAAVTTTGGVDLQAGQNVLVSGPITAGTVNINAAAGGAISGTGLITSPSINFQNLSGTSSVGLSGTPLLTSGTSSINFGMSGTGPSAVYMSHAGAATLGNLALFLGPNAPFSFLSTGNISVATAIATGTSNLTLSSSGGALATSGNLSGTTVSLTAVGNYAPVGNISATNLTIDLTGAGSKLTRAAGVTIGGTTSTTIKADKVDNSAATGVLGAAGSTVTLLPKASGRAITLGTDTADAGSDLELSTNDLGQVTASILRIGDNVSGALNIGAAIAPTNVSTLVLGSGSTVGQAAAGTISVANLGVKSLGTADLSTATNLVTGNIAASLGDGTHLNSDFKFNNSGGFIVGTVDSIPGISMQISGVYNSSSPDGVISLISASGGISQSSGTLAGKAVRATADGPVSLTGANPTGVISGNATAGDFSYTSINPISVTTVDSVSGVTATGYLVSLTGTSVGQTASASEVITAGSLKVIATTGGVNLGNDNLISGTVAGSAATDFSFKNTDGFSIGDATSGITASADISLNTVGAVTQTKPISATGLELLGVGGSYTLNDTSNSITTLAGNTGSVSLTNSAANWSIGTVNTVGLTTTGSSTLAGTGTLTNSSSIMVNAGTMAVSTSSFTQSGTLDVASSATFSRTSGFTNTGTISGSGTIAVGTSAAGLLNQGIITPGGDGTAGTLTINGDLQLSTGSNLKIDIGGTIAGTQYDVLSVTGVASLGETLTGSLVNSFTPDGQSFDVISANTAIGSFTTFNLPPGMNGAIITGTPYVYRLTHTGGTCIGVCWDGGAATTLWEDAANWTGDALPVSTDITYLNLVAGVTVDLASNQSIKGLNSDVNNHLNINSGGALTLNDAATTSTLLGNLTINGGTLTLNGPANLAALSLSGGTLSGTGALTVTGPFDITGSATLAGTGTLTTTGSTTVNNNTTGTIALGLDNKTWSNSGTITIGGDDQIKPNAAGTSTLTNNIGGVINLSSSIAEPFGYQLGTVTLNNSGTLNQTVTGTHGIHSAYTFNNSGTVNVQAGTLQIDAGGSDSGSYNISSGATAAFNYGTRNLTTGFALTGSGGTLHLSGGTVNVLNDLTFGNQTILQMSNNSVLGGTGALTVTGPFNVIGSATLAGTGTLTTSGTTTVNNNTTGTIALGLDNKTWSNSGTITIGGDDQIKPNAAGTSTLTNNIGGVINLSSSIAEPFGYQLGTVTLNNAGTLNQTVTGTHGIHSAYTFNNSGTVNVQAGTLQIDAGGSDSGSYNISSGATTAFNYGTRNLTTGFALTGSGGTLHLSGGTVNVLNNLTFANQTALLMSNNSVLGGIGALTVSGPFNVIGSSTLAGAGTLTTTGTTTINNNTTGTIVLGLDNKTWSNEGTLTIGGDDQIKTSAGSSILTNSSTGVINLSSSIAEPFGYYLGTVTINNQGTLNQTETGSHGISSYHPLNNSGTVNVQQGTLQVDGAFSSGGGSINVSAGSVFKTTAGSWDNNGILIGTGTIDVGASNTLANLGTIKPGGDAAIGTLSIIGNLELTGDGILEIEANGKNPGQFDILAVSGTTVMDGPLNATINFAPADADYLPFLTSVGEATGTFASFMAPGGFTVGYNLQTGEAARLIYTSTGDNVFTNSIGGLTWETAGNWSQSHIPTNVETALISSGYAVIHSTGTNTIAGLTINSANSLNVSGGSLTVSGFTLLDGTLQVSGTGTATLSGATSGSGSLNLSTGELYLNAPTTIANYTQTGGSLGGSGSFAVSNSFSATAGSINSAFTNLSITQATGNLSIGAPITTAGSILFNAPEISITAPVSGNNILYKTDDLNMSAKTTATGSITLLPATPGGGVDFGMANGGVLWLPDGNISGWLSAPLLRIGQPGAGEKAGDVSFGGAAVHGMNALSIFSSGTVSQQTDATIGATALQMTAQSVNLPEANPVGVIAGEATGGNFIYTSANHINLQTIDGIAGLKNSATMGQTVLTSGSGFGIGQAAGAPLVSTSANSSVALNASGPVILNQSGNSIGGYLSANLSSGSFEFTNDLGILVSGVSTTNQPISLTALSGDISVSGNINAGTSFVTLKTPGAININGGAMPVAVQGQGVKIESGSLAMTGAMGYEASIIAPSIGINTDSFTTSGPVELKGTVGISVKPLANGRVIAVGDGATGVGLVLDDLSATLFNTPKLRIGNEDTSGTYGAFSGDITIGGTGINRPGLQLGLTTNGAISQTGPLVVDALRLISGTNKNITLTNAGNSVNQLAAASGGDFSLTNSSASLLLASITGGVPAVTNNGISAPGKTVIITTTGSLLDDLESGPAITATTASLTAGSIGLAAEPLKTQVSYLAVPNSTGDVYVVNSGGLTTSGQIKSTGGAISLTAQSPLTIDSGGVSAATNITLTAGNSGSGDVLTLNGPLTATSGNISLTAGNEIVENSTISAGGTVSKAANQNPQPEPTPTPTPTPEPTPTPTPEPTPTPTPEPTPTPTPEPTPTPTPEPTPTPTPEPTPTPTPEPTPTPTPEPTPTPTPEPTPTPTPEPTPTPTPEPTPTPTPEPTPTPTPEPTPTPTPEPTPTPTPEPTPTPTPEPAPVKENTNTVVNSLEQVPTTPTAPAGLQLVAQAPSDDAPPSSGQSAGGGSGSNDSGGSGDGGNNSDDKDKDKDKDKEKDKDKNEQGQPQGGDKKDEKPKKNYCN